MNVLQEVLPQALCPLNAGADLLRSYELDACVGDPPGAVEREQRCEAVLIVHHRGVGELAAQRLDLEAISQAVKIAHWFDPCRTRPTVLGSRACAACSGAYPGGVAGKAHLSQ